MPFFWNQPQLSWGVELSTDQMYVVGLRDTSAQPQWCHQFCITAPNAFQSPEHLNNPMAMGKSLAQVLRGLNVRQGECTFALPGVELATLHRGAPKSSETMWQVVQNHLQQVAEPEQTWAFDFAITDELCTVAFCPQSLVNDYLLLASYTPLHVSALEPDSSATERALRVYWPHCLQDSVLLIVLTPRGSLWQVFSEQALVYQQSMPWRVSPEALRYSGWLNVQPDLAAGVQSLIQKLGDVAHFRVLLAGVWADQPELQTLLSEYWHQPPQVLDLNAVLGVPALTPIATESDTQSHAAQFLVALGLALRGCRHVTV